MFSVESRPITSVLLLCVLTLTTVMLIGWTFYPSPSEPITTAPPAPVEVEGDPRYIADPDITFDTYLWFGADGKPRFYKMKTDDPKRLTQPDLWMKLWKFDPKTDHPEVPLPRSKPSHEGIT